jgi:hypothetical protein
LGCGNLQQLGCQRGFADAGLAADEHQRAVPSDGVV